jgi:hypothetical protein
MNRAFIFLVLSVMFTCLSLLEAAELRDVNVYVTCDGQDTVGARLCLAVKDKILSSHDLQLVNEPTGKTGIAVHLVSVDASPGKLPKGTTSAVSVTYTFFGGPIQYYDGAQEFLVGVKKVTDIASSILSAIDKRAAKLTGQARQISYSHTPS